VQSGRQPEVSLEERAGSAKQIEQFIRRH